jgi:hypothetical protein
MLRNTPHSWAGYTHMRVFFLRFLYSILSAFYSVGIVRSRTQTMEFVCLFVLHSILASWNSWPIGLNLRYNPESAIWNTVMGTKNEKYLPSFLSVAQLNSFRLRLSEAQLFHFPSTRLIRNQGSVQHIFRWFCRYLETFATRSISSSFPYPP